MFYQTFKCLCQLCYSLKAITSMAIKSILFLLSNGPVKKKRTKQMQWTNRNAYAKRCQLLCCPYYTSDWFNIKFYTISAKQHETNPLLPNQLPYNNISSEFKFHRNPMWGTCKIDLIHGAQHLCTCLRTDGIKVMSNGFSLGGKQVIKYNQYKKSPSQTH